MTDPGGHDPDSMQDAKKTGSDFRAVEILLVEDSDEDAELTLRALQKHRLANLVYRVADGEEALEFLFSNGRYAERQGTLPRVVLLDLKLPKLNGMEVLERIRSDARTKPTPVVVLTSSAEDRDLAQCYRLGVNSYIVKPVDFEGFFKAVEQLGLYWALLNQTVR
jgi:CheY-like chemotaxis protein